MIEYDPRRSALYTPGKRETVFEEGAHYSPSSLAAEAARLAYVRAETSVAERGRLASALARVGFGDPNPMSDPKTGTQSFGAFRSSDRTALVAFRGTQPDELSDLATDLHAHTAEWHEAGGRVHRGFAAAARGIMPQVRAWLDARCADRSTLILSGHSLGAALATLAASVWRPSLLLTLGSPRVGDAAFAATLDGLTVVRVVNCCDIVTEIPPEVSAYTHVRAPTYIKRDGTRIEAPDAQFVTADRLAARSEYLAKYAWKIGAVLVRDLADHAPINYVRAFV